MYLLYVISIKYLLPKGYKYIFWHLLKKPKVKMRQPFWVQNNILLFVVAAEKCSIDIIPVWT